MKFLGFFIAIIAVVFMMENQQAKSATSCTGSATFGSNCSVSNCAAPYPTAKCTDGLFSATCQCVALNAPDPAHVNPSPTSTQYSDAASFASFLHTSPSTDLQNMEANINDAISGASNQNWTLYWSASDSWFSQFNNLSSTDKATINTWRYNHGYTDAL